MKVKLTYFKDSGKYYAEGRYASMNEFAFQVYREVSEMVERGSLPGLVEGARFIALVEPEDQPPALIIPREQP